MAYLAITIVAALLLVRKVDAKFTAHYLVVVQVAHGRRCGISNELAGNQALEPSWRHTGIWIVCKAKALGTSSLRVVDEAEAFDLASAAEDVGDLFLGKACVVRLAEARGRVR